MPGVVPRQTDVVVIGAGPVGLTAGLLLDQWQVDHLVVEAKKAPDDHPQAHFVSSRTMEIFRELGLAPAIRRAAPPLEEWCRHVYATDLAGLPRDPSSNEPSASLLGVDDHFPAGPDRRISPTWECHLSQPALTRLLREALVRRRPARLLEGWRARVHEKRDALEVVLAPTGGGRARRIRCRYVICADGAHSRNREGLAIARLPKTPPLQQLLNVHFVSGFRTAIGRPHRSTRAAVRSPAHRCCGPSVRSRRPRAGSRQRYRHRAAAGHARKTGRASGPSWEWR